MRILLFYTCFTCLWCSTALAQIDTAPITLGERLFIESTILGETRELWISKPSNYSDLNEHYPVLFLLDGDSHFRHASTTAKHLAESGRIPGLIVVAILNSDRGRDFTPPSKDPADIANFRTHGGADNFLRFLNEELFPFMASNYRVKPYKILLGHSLGGLFAMHTLFTQPEVFNAYIVIDPTMRWDDQVLVKLGEEYSRSNTELERDLYMTVANQSGETLDGIRKIAGALAESSPKGFRWDFRHMPEENHNSVTLRSTYQGLESIFEGWNLRDPMAVYELGGLAAIDNFYRKGGLRFGYARSMPSFMALQIADQLIDMNRLDEAAVLITEDFDATPPSYFLDLLAGKYAENGNYSRARELYTQSFSSNPTDILARDKLTDMGVDISQLVSMVDISEEVLISYVGTYKPLPDVQLRIFLDDSKLFQQWTGTPAAELVPVSQSRFSVTGADSHLEFFTDADSTVNRVIIYQFDRELEAPRIQ